MRAKDGAFRLGGRGGERRISHLRDMDPKNEFYLLFHAHICLIGGRPEEAKWLLESYNYKQVCHRERMWS